MWWKKKTALEDRYTNDGLESNPNASARDIDKVNKRIDSLVSLLRKRHTLRDDVFWKELDNI